MSKGHSPMDEQVREGNGVSKGTHLWMSKSGREGTRASEWHSPTGKCRQTVKSGREGIGASKQHSPMDGQVRKGGNQSKQAALTKGWARKGGNLL